MKKCYLIFYCFTAIFSIACETVSYSDVSTVDNVRIWIRPEYASSDNLKGEYVYVAKYSPRERKK